MIRSGAVLTRMRTEQAHVHGPVIDDLSLVTMTP
jgi:hypothetical protein